MDIDTILTEKPLFKLVKEYEENPKIEDLTEIFVVVIREDLPNWKLTNNEDEDLKESMRYFFFTSLEKAFKQYKYFGPRGSVLSRIITDDEELIALAEKSNRIIIPDDEEVKEEIEQK